MAFWICWAISVPFWIAGFLMCLSSLLANRVYHEGIRVEGPQAYKLRLMIFCYGATALIVAYFISHGIA